jgi:multidrug efflux pump subunit AcrA (membrane-fusion protein)
MAMAQARQRQARAQLDLVNQQISRASVTAPADGIVVAGDLTQALGAPVERGEELLEIAPGEGYEVHLYVDEKDIPYIAVGQSGTFTLAANPSERLPFRVEAIRPMALAREGRNVFQVETALSEETGELRPGQTGAGKVVVGEASLLWVWTRRFSDWLRLKVWVLAG